MKKSTIQTIIKIVAILLLVISFATISRFWLYVVICVFKSISPIVISGFILIKATFFL